MTRTAKMIGARHRRRSPAAAVGAYMDQPGGRASPPDRRHRRRCHPLPATTSSCACRPRSPSTPTAAAVKPQFDATLLEIARTAEQLTTRPMSTCSATPTRPALRQLQPGAVGQARAQSVAGYLSPHGVARARIALAAMARPRRSTIRNDTELERRRTAGSRSRLVPLSAASARAAKKPRSCSAASASPIPPSTSGRWWQVGWAKIRGAVDHAAALGILGGEAQRLDPRQRRSPRRTSRTAPASPTRCSRRAAAGRASPRPRGSRPFRHGRSDRASRAWRCAPRR